jgi:hypothetical protein
VSTTDNCPSDKHKLLRGFARFHGCSGQLGLRPATSSGRPTLIHRWTTAWLSLPLNKLPSCRLMVTSECFRPSLRGPRCCASNIYTHPKTKQQEPDGYHPSSLKKLNNVSCFVPCIRRPHERAQSSPVRCSRNTVLRSVARRKADIDQEAREVQVSTRSGHRRCVTSAKLLPWRTAIRIPSLSGVDGN